MKQASSTGGKTGSGFCGVESLTNLNDPLTEIEKKYKNKYENKILFCVRGQIKTNQDSFSSDIFRLFTGNTYIELLHDRNLTSPPPPGPLQFPATANNHRGLYKEGTL